MTPEALKQIIVAEVLRALRELGIAVPAPPASSAPAVSPLGDGLVVLTGFNPPAPALPDLLAGIAAQGGRPRALPSHTFRQTQAARGGLPRGAEPIPNPDDEAAFLDLAPRLAWTLIPDASTNTLAKAVLGIEDSSPTRAIAAALRLKKPCLFVECVKPESPAAGTARHNLLRQMQSARGALLADAASAAQSLRDALYPKQERPFKPAPPKPSVRHPIVTKDDIYEAFAAGLKTLDVPSDAIVTMEAAEDAARRGIDIKRQNE